MVGFGVEEQVRGLLREVKEIDRRAVSQILIPLKAGLVGVIAEEGAAQAEIDLVDGAELG